MTAHNCPELCEDLNPPLPAPRIEYDRPAGQFDESVTRVDGGGLPWHVVPHLGVHKDHEDKPEPQPKLQAAALPSIQRSPSCKTERPTT
jgi:hypothetical protein